MAEGPRPAVEDSRTVGGMRSCCTLMLALSRLALPARSTWAPAGMRTITVVITELGITSKEKEVPASRPLRAAPFSTCRRARSDSSTP